MKKPEILSPAGSFDALKAACLAGADAVYLSGAQYGARAYAKNFDNEELALAVQYAHERGVLVYLTVNTLVTDREMDELKNYIAYLCKLSVDALIVQDLGLAAVISAWAPELPLHASTQCAVHSLDGVIKLHEMGFTRVVLARELSLGNIAAIAKKAPCELEVFVHGALCFSHSGSCLMSAVIGRRSANRGRCAGPCRLPYSLDGGKARHMLSLKDLCMTSALRELTNMGIASFKIEGRMRRPEYVSSVTRTYATAVKYGVKPTKNEISTLSDIFSRSGFTAGYADGELSRDMFGMRDESEPEKYEAALAKERESYEVPPPITMKGKVDFDITILAGERVSLRAICTSQTATVTGEPPEPAISRPISEEIVQRQLKKCGGTGFEAGEIRVTLGENLSLAASTLNGLRRDALAALGAALGDSKELSFDGEKAEQVINITSEKAGLTAAFSYIKQLPEALSALKIAYLPLTALAEDMESTKELLKRQVKIGVTLPRVITDSERADVKTKLSALRELGIADALCEGIGQIPLLTELSFSFVADIPMNAMNSHTLLLYKKMGAAGVICSAELSVAQIRDMKKPLPCGIFAYGRLPLMVSENCLKKNESGCAGRCKLPATLTDRTGQSFYVTREYGCRNIILNGKTLFFADKKDELLAAGAAFMHLSFTTESRDECEKVISAYLLGAGEKPLDFTRGLLTRGVE